jgi:hypothetical protein
MIAYQAHRIPFMSVRLGDGFETQAAIRSSPAQNHLFVFFSMSGIIGNLQSIDGFMHVVPRVINTNPPARTHTTAV